MNPLLIIGDVHRKINEYQKIITGIGEKISSIQVGDFGFKKEHEWFLSNVNPRQHQIVFGNHDDYSFLRSPHSLQDFSWFQEEKIMTVRGAYSIDRAQRIEGVDWWENEELNYTEMQTAVNYYRHQKPRIMITHDCPFSVRERLFDLRKTGWFHNKSITTNGLQIMLEAHQPEMWIFGHHHKSRNEVINGTRFICLAELETIII